MQRQTRELLPGAPEQGDLKRFNVSSVSGWPSEPVGSTGVGGQSARDGSGIAQPSRGHSGIAGTNDFTATSRSTRSARASVASITSDQLQNDAETRKKENRSQTIVAAVWAVLTMLSGTFATAALFNEDWLRGPVGDNSCGLTR